MKSTKLLKMTFLLVLLFTVYGEIVKAQENDCDNGTDERNYARKFVSSLPGITGKDARQGRFIVRKMKRNPNVFTNAFTVSFVNGKKVIFRKEVLIPDFLKDDVSCNQGIFARTKKGVSTLYFDYVCGQGMISTGCAIRVFPHTESNGAASWQHKVYQPY